MSTFVRTKGGSLWLSKDAEIHALLLGLSLYTKHPKDWLVLEGFIILVMS